MHFDLNQYIYDVHAFVTGWPLIIFVIVASIVCTISFSFVQFRYFLKMFKLTLFPDKQDFKKGQAGLSPLQAFTNSLGLGLGNGSIAGVATSIYAGGPGSVFWLVFIGFFLMAIRFAEVFLSIYYTDIHAHVGGPIVYLKRLFAGRYLAYCYAILALCYALVMGNAIQTNAISISLQTMGNIDPIIIAAGILFFVLYLLRGGAQRILAFSDRIVPFKVILFFVSSLVVLLYHWQSLAGAVVLICKSAFTYTALAGGMVGYSVQQAMRFGIFRAVMATEAGLGTSGILFGSTESKQPMEDGLMSMLAVFVSTLVCALVGLCIVASGVWDSGLASTALTIAAFQTVFGVFGGWVVTVLSVSFGIGLLVSYAFVARTVWRYLTGNRYEWLGNGIYCLFACMGALSNAHILWYVGDIINAAMILLNVSAIMLLSKVIKDGIASYKRDHTSH